MEKLNAGGHRVMSANIIRLDRLALVVVLVTFGLIFKFVVLIRVLCSAAKKLATMGLRRVHAWRALSRAHLPPAA
jgi:hypothetical protein